MTLRYRIGAWLLAPWLRRERALVDARAAEHDPECQLGYYWTGRRTAIDRILQGELPPPPTPPLVGAGWVKPVSPPRPEDRPRGLPPVLRPSA